MAITLDNFDRFVSDQLSNPTSAARRLWPDGMVSRLVVVLTPQELDALVTDLPRYEAIHAGHKFAPFTGRCVSLDGVAREAASVECVGTYGGTWILRSAETLPAVRDEDMPAPLPIEYAAA